MLSKFHNKAFAIKFKSGSKEDKEGLYDLWKLVAVQYPAIKIEGVNRDKRNAEAIKAIARIGNVILAKSKKERRDLVCVGVSDKFDISFENSKNLQIGGFYYPIPVYDIRDNAADIVEHLHSYLKEQYPLTHTLHTHNHAYDCKNTVIIVNAPKRKPQVTFHSTYVQVGRKAMSWEEYYRYKATVENAATEVEVSTKSRSSLERFIFAA